MNKITLQFDKTKTALAGNPYGVKVFEEQVPEDFRIEDGIEIVFPDAIMLVASSFVQGFFSKWSEMYGSDFLKENVRIVSNNEYVRNSILRDMP